MVCAIFYLTLPIVNGNRIHLTNEQPKVAIKRKTASPPLSRDFFQDAQPFKVPDQGIGRWGAYRQSRLDVNCGKYRFAVQHIEHQQAIGGSLAKLPYLLFHLGTQGQNLPEDIPALGCCFRNSGQKEAYPVDKGNRRVPLISFLISFVGSGKGSVEMFLQQLHGSFIHGCLP